MDIKSLDKLAKLCRKHGITQYTTPELSLQFDHSQSESAISNTPPATDTASIPVTGNAYSDEDVVLWSTPSV